MYQIAKINNTHGIKGTLKVSNLSDFNRLYKDAKVYYLDNDNNEVYLTINKVIKSNNIYLIDFKEINNIDDAALLKNKLLYSNELPITDEITYQELIGLEVILSSGEYLGKINNIIFNPVHDILEVIGIKKYLIPFNNIFVKEINRKKQLVINPIDGLL